MDNSISINLNSENNSMNSLSFSWRARFKNNSELNQFENGKENLFQLVKDRFTELSYFYLISKDNLQCFTVDLLHGLIFYNNHQEIDYNQLEKKENCRLIFFRRHQIKMSINGKEKSHTIEYHLGFQWLKDGKNQKIILIIDEEGNFIINN